MAQTEASDRVIESGPTSRVFFSQRLRLHYVDWGNAGAPPLLLMHGGRDRCRKGLRGNKRFKVVVG